MTEPNTENTGIVDPKKPGLASFQISLDIRNLAEPIVRKFRNAYDDITEQVAAKADDETKKSAKLKKQADAELEAHAKTLTRVTDYQELAKQVQQDTNVELQVSVTVRDARIRKEEDDDPSSYRLQIKVTGGRDEEKAAASVSISANFEEVIPDNILQLYRQSHEHSAAAVEFRQDWETRKKRRRQALDDAMAQAEEHITVDQLSRTDEGTELQQKLAAAGEALAASLHTSFEKLLEAKTPKGLPE